MKNRIIVGLVLAAVLLLCLMVYRSYSGDRLNVDPHAAREIEKAKRR